MEECCNEKESCCAATPQDMRDAIIKALSLGEKFKMVGGIGGREVALVCTHLEDALFRAERYERQLEITSLGMAAANCAKAVTAEACKA